MRGPSTVPPILRPAIAAVAAAFLALMIAAPPGQAEALAVGSLSASGSPPGQSTSDGGGAERQVTFEGLKPNTSGVPGPSDQGTFPVTGTFVSPPTGLSRAHVGADTA